MFNFFWSQPAINIKSVVCQKILMDISEMTRCQSKSLHSSTIMKSWQHTISFIDHSLNHHGKNTSVQIKVKLKKKKWREKTGQINVHSPKSVTFILLDLHDLVLYFMQTNNTKKSNQYLKSQYGFDYQRRLTTALN